MEISMKDELGANIKLWSEKGTGALPGNIEFEGPVKRRRCEDGAWAGILFTALVTAVSISYYCIFYPAVSSARPSLLLHGYDYQGLPCGSGQSLSLEYTYILNPLSSPASLCLDGCPILHDSNAICLPSSPSPSEPHCFDAYLSKGYYHHYCLPADPISRQAVLDYLNSMEFTVIRLLGDVIRGWDILAISVGLTILMGFAALGGIRFYVGRVGLWAAGGCGTVSGLAGLCWCLYKEADRLKSIKCADFGPVTMPNCSISDEFSYISVSFAVFSLLLLSMLAWNCKDIRVSETSLKITAIPFNAIPQLALIPLFGLIAALGVLGFTLFSVVSTGTVSRMVDISDLIVPEKIRKSVEFGEYNGYLIGALVGVGGWVVAFLSCFVEFLTAGICEKWYFSKGRIAVLPTFWAAFRLSMLNIGSIAYASAAVPLLTIPRVCVFAVKMTGKRLGISSQRWYLLACGPFVYLYEKTLKFRVETVVAYQALWGGGLEEAGRNGFYARKRGRKERLIEGGARGVWGTGVTIRLIAPLGCFWMVMGQRETFLGTPTKFITSPSFLALVSLFFSWSVSSILVSSIRGAFNGVLFSYLTECETSPILTRPYSAQLSVLIESVCDSMPTSSDSMKQVTFAQKWLYAQRRDVLNEEGKGNDDCTDGYKAELDVSEDAVIPQDANGHPRALNTTQLPNDDSILCNEDRPLSISDNVDWEETKEQKKRVAFLPMSEEGERRKEKYEKVKGGRGRRHSGDEEQQQPSPSPPLSPFPHIT